MYSTLRPVRDLAAITASVIAILLVLPLPYLAAASIQGAEITFERFDRNRDGFIDAREAARLPELLAAFARADLNGDARLDRVEFARAL